MSKTPIIELDIVFKATNRLKAISNSSIRIRIRIRIFINVHIGHVD